MVLGPACGPRGFLATQVPGDRRSTAPQRILCLGIDGGALEHVSRALGEGCGVEPAMDAAAAAAAIREGRADLVLAGAQEGLALLAKLGSESHEPVILLGRPESEDLCLQGVEAGASDYLVEPFAYRVLAVRVAACLRAVRARAIEEELRRSQQEAHAANEAKDHFLATLSHELRTPLTPVLAVVSRLEADPRLEFATDELAMIRRNVELEARMIDDLLDLTRVSRGKFELRRRRTDVRQVIEHALSTAERDLTAKSLDLTVQLAAEDHRVWADAPRLTQVFWNLLSNAVKFTPPGGRVAVESRTARTPVGLQELVVEVRDTGIGIEPDVLPRIFEAFEQTDRRITRRFGGLGLGLAVCRAIVDLHGGRLTAASAGKGRGATFAVHLPLGGPQEDLDETGAWFRTRSLPGSPPPPQSPLHILLVEDHADTAAAMADVLRLSGHEVTVAGSVAEALAAAESSGNGGRRLDLVVSDLGLPDGSGQDLMRQLSQLHGLKGIALSGYGMEDDVRRSFEAGFLCHLTKPVDRLALEATIRLVMGRG